MEELAVKRSKGRPSKPKGDENSIIRDPLLGDFYIKLSKDCFTLMKENKPSKDKECGFYTSLESAINSVMKRQVNEKMLRPNQVYSFRQYIDEYKDAVNNLNTKLKQIT